MWKILLSNEWLHASCKRTLFKDAYLIICRCGFALKYLLVTLCTVGWISPLKHTQSAYQAKVTYISQSVGGKKKRRRAEKGERQEKKHSGGDGAEKEERK